MFKRKETPPPGFIRPEEFAEGCGLSTATVLGLCNTGMIMRLGNLEFGMWTYERKDEDDPFVYPNFGVNGLIPEDELDRFLWRCWTGDWPRRGPVKPAAIRKVREFICQPGNEALRESLMAPRSTPTGKAEEPQAGEYATWDLFLLYGVGEESWSRLMKRGIMRYRHLCANIGGHFKRVALSGEVERLAKECPEVLPRAVRKRLSTTGKLLAPGGLESYERKKQHEQWVQEGAWDKIDADFYGRVLPQATGSIAFQGRTYVEIPRSRWHLPLSETVARLTG